MPERSIPARAGEPDFSRATLWGVAVYPRACGGTTPAVSTLSAKSGLSPRVRGNPDRSSIPVAAVGSIPARAGEPAVKAYQGLIVAVYPRACGGTDTPPNAPPPSAGLSPRVRGNQYLHRTRRPLQRSIPARAGEPEHPTGNRAVYGVYPRACGGTTPSAVKPDWKGGLSPRVRGNRNPHPSRQGRRRSIPARAGEPGPEACRQWCSRVYPRACGGTWPGGV